MASPTSYTRASYFTWPNQQPSQLPEADMKNEAGRLKSFVNWTTYGRASPVLLAKAGFVYTGNEDVVKCFICHVTKGGWNRNMNPMEVHKELNPECRFCQGEDGLNIPVYVPEESVYQEILESLRIQYCGTDTPVSNSAELSRQLVDNLDYLTDTFRQNQTTETQTIFPAVASDAGTAKSSCQAIGVRGALVRGHDSGAAPTREEFAPMKQESNRFASFDSNWPRQDTPDPRDLAGAGFYYTGTVDRVQCVFCRGILRNWDEDDVPMDEHKRHFPTCPFVMGIEVGNIPDTTTIIANRTGEFLNVTQPLSVVSDASLGTERPKHSQYAVEAARITSFRNWSSGKEQTPQMLAKAGFFYAGFGDSVKCFFCDGGLRTWERGDDPWREHARWFPHCKYIAQVKGEDFIKAAMEGQEPSTTAATARNNGGRSLPGTSATDTARKASSTAPRSVDPGELSSRMDSPVVQAVLQMDIPRETVAKVIQKRLQETGDDFQSVEALLDAILQAFDDDATFTTEVKTVSGQIDSVNYALEENRVSSFKNSSITGKIVHMLAKAGFYYPGTGDQVRCFFCKGDHATWRRDGVPWLEHAQLNPFCPNHPDMIVYGPRLEDSSARETDDSEQERVGSQDEPTQWRTQCMGASATTLDENRSQTIQSNRSKEAGITSDENQVKEENEKMKQQLVCKICMDAEVNVVFLPCGHLVSCVSCAPDLQNCPICRAKISGTIRTYLS